MRVSLVFLLLCVSALAYAENCKWRKNYIYFATRGEFEISGLSPINALRCFRQALKIYENSISGLRLVYVNENYEHDVNVIFEKFGTNFKKITHGITNVNCTVENYSPGEDISTIRNADLIFNTDLHYFCRESFTPSVPTNNAIDFFYISLHYIGQVMGLDLNDDPTSIMYRNLDNFQYYRNNGTLNVGDMHRLNQLYLLETDPEKKNMGSGDDSII